MRAPKAVYRVEARRGPSGVVEARHRVTVVAWDADFEARAVRGTTPESLLPAGAFVTYFRSGCKPFQLLPLVERGHAEKLALGDRELAVAGASHSGAPEHLDAARAILQAAGVPEEALLCGAHPPRDESNLAAYAAAPSPLYNNCSGKHAAMLALAACEGWDWAEYVDAAHPVQRATLDAVLAVCGVADDEVPVAVDGCSAANPAISLAAMARGFQRFATAQADASSARERALARIRQAFAAEPFYVAGQGRLCTDVMRTTRGRVVTKTGAEGLQCAALPARGVGIALKVEDGADRAKGPALLAFLRENGWLESEELASLESWAHPTLTNVRGIPVGRLEWRAEPVATHA